MRGDAFTTAKFIEVSFGISTCLCLDIFVLLHTEGTNLIIGDPTGEYRNLCETLCVLSKIYTAHWCYCFILAVIPS